MKINAAFAVVCVLALFAALHAQTTQPVATQPHVDRAALPLAQVEPGLALPQPTATAEPELPGQAGELLAEADKLLAEKRGVLAIVRLEKALSYAPKSRRIHLTLGRAHLQTGNAAKGELHLARALALGSDDQSAWHLLATAQRDLKRDAAAMRSLLLANLATPVAADSPVAVLLPYELGSLLDAQGYSAAALPLLEKAQATLAGGKLSPAQKSDPKIAELLRTGMAALSADIARLQVATGQARDAIVVLEKLVSSGQADRAVYLALIQAYLKNGANDKAGRTVAALAGTFSSAEADSLVDSLAQPFGKLPPAAALLKDAMPSRPKAGDVTLVLAAAIAQARIDQRAEASRIARELVHAVANCPVAVFIRCIELQDSPAAKLTLWRDGLTAYPDDAALLATGEKLLELDSVAAGNLSADLAQSTDAASLYVRGRLLAAASQPDEAMKHFEKSAQQKPDFAPAYVERMKLHAAAGEHDKALAIREQAGKAGLKSAAVHHLAGLAWLKKAGSAPTPELLAKALDELRLAEQLDRDNVEIVLALADAYLADGQTASGLRRLRRMYEKYPRNTTVLLRLTWANEAIGQLDEAFMYADSARKLDPRILDADRIRGLRLLSEGKSREAIMILEINARQSPQDARSQAAFGRALVAGARWAEAVKPLQKALALDSSMIEARRALADAFSKTGRLNEAVEQWRLLVDKLPNDIEMVGSLMAELIRRGDLDEAAGLLDKLSAGRDEFADQLIAAAIDGRKFDLALRIITRQIELAGDDQALRRTWQFRKVQLLSAQGKNDEAIAAAAEFHKRYPNDHQLTAIYVAALLKARRVDEAVKVAQAAHDADTEASEPASLYFQALLAAKRFDRALELVEALARRSQDPDEVQHWRISRVHVLQAARRHEDAIKAAGQLYDETPQSPVVTLLNVRVLVWAKQYDKALAVLDKGLKDGIDPDILVEMRMQTLAWLGKFDEMTKLLDGLLAKIEGDELKSEVWYMVGAIYSMVRKVDECHKALEQALKLNPLNASACNDLGYHLADSGRDLDRAERLIRIAVEQRPTVSAYLDSLAWVLYKKGNFKESAELLARVMDQEPEPEAVILDHYGDVLWRLGKRDEAIKQWQAATDARQADPDHQVGLEESTDERTRAKLKAAEQPDGQVPVAPLGDGVVPPGAART